MIGDVFTWLNDPAHWRDRDADSFIGIPSQILTHLRYSGLAILIAAAIALPLGLLIGHTRKGTAGVAAVNALRSIPTVGLLVLLALIISPHYFGKTDLGYLIPTEIVLVVIAIPPILANTYAGVDNVDPAVRDGAKGMGMTSSQVLFKVELPNALPLIFSGFRSAALQVIATATIAAYFPLGGLGRFIYDGFGQQDYPQMISGGVLVAILAVLVDLAFALVQRFVVSPGVSRRFKRGTTAKSDDPPALPADAAGAAIRREEAAIGST